ncbi:POTRA domain-containing protein [Commensalibacter oyaizuii]|uniref:Polypeptide-transport-associated ShlB-type domain-containing protein n=1 Tax=Commensalibacter oyaizuii TaxID=3043873 RepID=A0ABT6Q3N9_9PROT|nr:POTRA domain-containing protein [Commensalibacter sp. TBRC 16381]MDI2091746.1 hypothetical protein [Commensalibacter sp. TBRC 16381]
MKLTRKKPILTNICMAISVLITYSWIHEGYAADTHQNHQKASKTHTKVKSAMVEKEHASVTREKTSATYPVIDHIFFTGNTVFLEQKLKQAIPLQTNNLAEASLIMSSMVRIAELYKGKNIKVTITPVLKKTIYNHVDLNFDIHEQKK